ncbi:helix-turn-helix domain-containing protein [Sphingomonas sp. H39-1-10]|uniref:helix-turn-helix domain-containing protein n=1 Tax=Sphingomonas pollutisoli TaxID=3030829 RepID=UPI0023B9CF3E|nr:helix-turn-helix domain-containing protein [Sphingomonas pollutisoli]MDF0487966.1 helix-turn-helix domain-containing protein [Sphingomonas pollutisoli]
MTDAEPVEPAKPLPRTPGERLREAREAQGLSLDEVAARTRVPLRQLQAIEDGNYAALPSITYSVGFAKAYARAVGADEVSIARDVRAQNTHQPAVRRTEYVAYEPDEPKREPSGLVAVVGVALALLLLIAAGLWFGTTWFRGDSAAPAAATDTAAQTAVPEAPATPAPVPAGGQVTLTAKDDVWLRIYDRDGTVYENTLKPGDSYAVPQDRAGLMINVGRPDKLTVTVNGSAVPALGDGRVPIKDVPISASALLARGNAAAPVAAATPPAAASPAARAAPRATPRHRESAAEANAAALNIAAPASAPPAPAATPAP